MSKQEAAQEVVDTGPKKAKRVNGITKEAKLTVLTQVNPKREGSQAFDRFEGYFKLETGATVQDALDAGLTIGDVRYDVIHGSIAVEGATVEEYEVTPRSESEDAAAEAAGADTASATDSGF